MPLRRRDQYDFINDDGLDTRVPVYSDEAFKHGIHFTAKYIGTLEVQRPQNRLEIVSSMRRIRHEFKAKGIKKRKVVLTISVDGVSVQIRYKRQKKSMKKGQLNEKDESIDLSMDQADLLLHHPIYRIFYVSHDSQDLNIFSYIAREGKSSTFKCNVFKTYKKVQAMRIVRTIGQSFDVSHRLTLQKSKSNQSSGNECAIKAKVDDVTKVVIELDQSNTEEKKWGSNDASTAESKLKVESEFKQVETAKKNHENAGNDVTSPNTNFDVSSSVDTLQNAENSTSPQLSACTLSDFTTSGTTGISQHHETLLLQQQLEQQAQYTKVAVAQVLLLKAQIAAESSARIEGQSRIRLLLLQNRQLINHLNQLVHRIQELENQTSNSQTFEVHPTDTATIHTNSRIVTTTSSGAVKNSLNNDSIKLIAENDRCINLSRRSSFDQWEAFTLSRSPSSNNNTNTNIANQNAGSSLAINNPIYISQSQDSLKLCKRNNPAYDEVEAAFLKDTPVPWPSTMLPNIQNNNSMTSAMYISSYSTIARDASVGSISYFGDDHTSLSNRDREATESPDSGHREMSTDSLSTALTFSEDYPKQVSIGKFSQSKRPAYNNAQTKIAPPSTNQKVFNGRSINEVSTNHVSTDVNANVRKEKDPIELLPSTMSQKTSDKLTISSEILRKKGFNSNNPFLIEEEVAVFESVKQNDDILTVVLKSN